MRIVFVALVLGAPFVAPARAQTADRAFSKLKAEGIESRKAMLKAFHRADVRFRPLTLPTPALSAQETATAAAMATAAISTGLDGVEAGVSVSPLLLAGRGDLPVQPTVTLAALKDTGARGGIGANLSLAASALSPDQLGFKGCPIPDDTALAEALQAFREPFVGACEQFISRATGPKDEATAELLADAKWACGEAQSGPKLDFAQALGTVGFVSEVFAKDPLPSGQSEDALKAWNSAKSHLIELMHPKLPVPDSCFGTDEVKAAVALSRFNALTGNIGVSTNVDLFPLLWGFSPDGSDLAAAGKFKSWAIRGEARVSGKGVEGKTSVTFERGREKSGETLYSTLTTTFGAAVAVARLSAGSLRNGKGELEPVEGELPPRLILGTSVSFAYAGTRPESQVSLFNELDFRVFADFIFSDKLAVRIGVPVHAKILTREKTDALPELRDLQWSVPLTIATVFKLD